jgi:hypothetical protein
VERPYHTIDRKDTQAVAHFLSRHGQGLLPMVELIEQSEVAGSHDSEGGAQLCDPMPALC